MNRFSLVGILFFIFATLAWAKSPADSCDCLRLDQMNAGAVHKVSHRDHDRWECVAKDRGWEEHWGGHRSICSGLQCAQHCAVEKCRDYHGRCVISSCRPLR